MINESHPCLIKVDLPNGKTQRIAYLIHGTNFELHCKFEGFKAMFIYNPIPVGKWNWPKNWHRVDPEGIFGGKANFYQPYLEIYLYRKPWFQGFWWLWATKGGAQKLRIELKVEFPNVIEQDILLAIHHRDLKVAEVMDHAPSVSPPITRIPVLSRLNFGLRLAPQTPVFSMPRMNVNHRAIQKDLNF